MKTSIDRAQTSFLIAASIMTRFGTASHDEAGADAEPTVVFMAGPAGNAMARREMAALAERSGKDLVLLEFERGARAKGPRNIVVFRVEADGVATWPRCALWSRRESPLTVILPRGSDFAFGYDGVGLRRMTGAPTKGLAPGFAAATAELRAIASRMTPEMLNQLVVVSTRACGDSQSVMDVIHASDGSRRTYRRPVGEDRAALSGQADGPWPERQGQSAVCGSGPVDRAHRQPVARSA